MNNGVSSLRGPVCEPVEGGIIKITDKADEIEKGIDVIKEYVNEICNRLCGGSVPMNTACCGNEPVVNKYLERTLTNINGSTRDIIGMLNDILKAL